MQLHKNQIKFLDRQSIDNLYMLEKILNKKMEADNFEEQKT